MFGALPKSNNNPFALIQPDPSPWQGLVGKTASGFLIFDTPANGARAGFINLINTYINKGINTIEKIFPKYAPAGHGNNDPASYIALVEKKTGIPRNQPISSEQDLYKIGRAIVEVEEGNFWLSEADFKAAFNAAISNRNIMYVAKVAGIGIGGLIVVGAIVYAIYMATRPEQTEQPEQTKPEQQNENVPEAL